MTADRQPKSLTQATYERLHRDVLSCVLPPGSRVNVKELAEQYEASAGAVREALSRMTSEGLVIAEPQKGFRISAVSLEDLNDLTQARIEIEASCLRHSFENSSIAWEARLVSAYHCLSRITGPDTSDEYEADGWNAAHKAFHEALVSACPNNWLLRMRTMLFEQTARYRAMSIAMTTRNRDITVEHKQLFDAALAKDADKASQLLIHHIQMTSSALIKGLKGVQEMKEQ